MFAPLMENNSQRFI